MPRPQMRVTGVVLATPDPRALAAFYVRLLGWGVAREEGPRPGAPPEDGWALLRPPAGEAGVYGDTTDAIWSGLPTEQRQHNEPTDLCR
jgi:catechol 2,3-dioxygenase-like lactoylglutathione lyase family enzyme